MFNVYGCFVISPREKFVCLYVPIYCELGIVNNYKVLYNRGIDFKIIEKKFYKTGRYY